MWIYKELLYYYYCWHDQSFLELSIFFWEKFHFKKWPRNWALTFWRGWSWFIVTFSPGSLAGIAPVYGGRGKLSQLLSGVPPPPFHVRLSLGQGIHPQDVKTGLCGTMNTKIGQILAKLEKSFWSINLN